MTDENTLNKLDELRNYLISEENRYIVKSSHGDNISNHLLMECERIRSHLEGLFPELEAYVQTREVGNKHGH